MKFLIVGAGGVGGYFGARLAADGNDVTFVARGAHRAAMAETGLKIVSPQGDLHLERPRLHEDAATTGLCDIVLIAVKLYDLEAAGELVKPMLAHDTAVVALQNGITAEDTLAGILGPQHVLGGVARIFAAITEPGVIHHTSSFARMTFGELDGASTWRQECLEAACTGAGLDVEVAGDITLDLWQKFIGLAPSAGATSLYRCSMGEVMADSERRATIAALVDETVAVGRAKGAALPDGTEAGVMKALAALPPELKTSMLHDLEAGRRLELPWLNGEVVRLGQELGIDTPANARVVEALGPYAGGKEA